jgi:hypothetical protein
MASKPFHKTGIAVSAPMSATHIGIDAVIKTFNRRSGQNRLCKYFFDDHGNIITYEGAAFEWAEKGLGK